MARYLRFQLILSGFAWLGLTGFATAQPPLPPPAPPPGAEDRADPQREGHKRREGNPERLRRNLDRWKKMSPRDREAMRQLHERRRDVIRREIAETIERSGLMLDEEAERRFARRYHQERRKVEEQIWREMEEKRKERLKEIVEELVTEFRQAEASAAAVPEVSASPTPMVEPVP